MTAEIPETEVVMLLNSNPVYCDLQRRRVFLELNWRRIAAAPEMKQPPGVAAATVASDPKKKQPDSVEQKPAPQVLPDKSQPASAPTAPVPASDSQRTKNPHVNSLVPTVPVPVSDSQRMKNPLVASVVPPIPVPDWDFEQMSIRFGGPWVPTVPAPDWDLQRMKHPRASLEQKAAEQALRDKMKHVPEGAPIAADWEATTQQLDSLKEEAVEQIRGAKRIALKQDIDRLESQAEILADQIAAFEKEVEHKGNEADSVGRSTVNAQMMRAEVENVERILREVGEERERLRVELKSPRRVEILGDPNSPAAVPESPD